MRSIGMRVRQHAHRLSDAAAHCRSNDAQLVHELCELLRKERLRAIGDGLVGVGMDFDQQSVAAGRDRGARHCATMSRRPVPCEGSPSIGRCDSFFTTGMAEMSIVLRV